LSQKVDLKIDWATQEAATFACVNWHYSKCVPKSKQNKIGVWENGKFIGVVMIGSSSGNHTFEFLGLDQFSGAELTRVALTNHQSPVTRIIKIAFTFLKKKNPLLKALVSYADANQGHHGGIYQGGNWKYFGLSNPCTQWFFRGKWRNDIKLSVFFKGRTALRDTLPQKKLTGKHKYVYFFDKELESRFKNSFKEYPKRAGSKDIVVHPDQG
jgi:hypothetical protein